jgi:hypothetical protein
MFVPTAAAVSVAIECNLVVPRDRCQLIDDLLAYRAQVGRFGSDSNAGAISLSRQIEEIFDDVLNAVHGAFDDLCLLPDETGRIGDVPQPMLSDPDRMKWIADVMADDRENPLLEVARESKLFLVACSLGFLGLTALVDVHTAADEACECIRLIGKRNPTVEDPSVRAVVAT